MQMGPGYPGAPTPEEIWFRAEFDPAVYVGYLAYHGYLSGWLAIYEDPVGRPYLEEAA